MNGPRRSKRLTQRSSSLGEESETDQFRSSGSSTANKKTKILSTTPNFKIGLIADIQYAPIPDGYSYAGIPRYYSHALEVARHAAKHFEEEKVSFMINLGDIVDGKCQAIEKNGGDPLPSDVEDAGHYVVEQVLKALSAYKSGPVLHSYGNHCLYNLDRKTLESKLGIPFVREPCGDLVGYSSFLHKGFRFVTLDSYDVAKMQRCNVNSQKHKEAVEILIQNNPNYHENENSPDGLVGVARRFVAFNGAVGPVQLDWLRQTLADTRKSNERAIILSHQPILPGSSSPVCLMWNYKDVLAVLREYKDVVVASFAGHAHKGGYKRDHSGIHFRVFEAALENPHPYKTYAIIDVHYDHIRVNGFGSCRSAVYEFDHLPPVQQDSATT